MSANIIPSKREAYAAFLRNLAADGQPQTAEVLATLLFDADRVASLVEQVARLTEQVDALTTDRDNARTLAEAAMERVEVLEQNAETDRERVGHLAQDMDRLRDGPTVYGPVRSVPMGMDPEELSAQVAQMRRYADAVTRGESPF
jgi:hypothetical protein